MPVLVSVGVCWLSCIRKDCKSCRPWPRVSKYQGEREDGVRTVLAGCSQYHILNIDQLTEDCSAPSVDVCY